MVQWMKDGSIFYNDIVELSNDIYTSSLIQSHINASDAGIYNCTAVVDSNSEYIVNSSEVNVVEIITVISG